MRNRVPDSPVRTGVGVLVRRLAAVTAAILPSRLRTAMYRLPGSDVLRKALSLGASSNPTPVRIAAGLGRGLTMQLDLTREKYYWLGTYEPQVGRVFERIVNPGSVVFDIGAHVGYWSLGLARLVGAAGHVVAFEPLPENHRRLMANIALNEFEPAVHAVAAAVTDQDGPETLEVHGNTSMSRLVGVHGRVTEFRRALAVRGLTLDTFVFAEKNPHPEVIKMDIEGGEERAILGMRRVLAECRPILLIELHGPVAARSCASVLRSSSYQLFCLGNDGGLRPLGPRDELPWRIHVLALPNRTTPDQG